MVHADKITSLKQEKKRIFIVGPTGVGKSALALHLAKDLQGEILSLDSMQIYRGMDIGTAKATIEEQHIVPHHLLDIAEPSERYTVADYQRDAEKAENDVFARGKLPIFVGGTGLYLNALLMNYQFSGMDTTSSWRSVLEEEYRKDQGIALYQELTLHDPETAKRLTPNDKPRLLRAVEILRRTGQAPSLLRRDRENETWKSLVLVLSLPREQLYEAINARVLRMVDAGLAREVHALIHQGVPPESQAMRAIGYREYVWYFRGLLTEEETIRLIQRASRQYAKRQYTWYRKTKEALWIEEENPKKRIERAKQEILAFLNVKQ